MCKLFKFKVLLEENKIMDSVNTQENSGFENFSNSILSGCGLSAEMRTHFFPLIIEGP
jgi:hypothetical protein